MTKKLLLLCLPFMGTVAMAQSDDAAKYAELITQKGLKEKLTIVASAEMEGRETGTPGQKKAAAYIESEFKKFGLKPGNGDSYQQVYPILQETLTEKKLSVNGTAFTWDQDFSFSLPRLSNTWNYQEVVFAGEGIIDTVKNTNDYAGLDVKGKLVLVVDNGAAASSIPPAAIYSWDADGKVAVSFPNAARGRGFGGGNTSRLLSNALRNGAVGIIVVSKDFPKKNPSPTKGRMSISLVTTGNTVLPAISVSTDVAAAIVGKKVDFDELKNVQKGSYKAKLDISAIKTPETVAESSNVIGIIPGTDKKDEYVFLTGHYDHLGKNATGIWYGADDDGSGTVTVMQMAEAFSAAAKKGKKPRRTMVFMTVSGEEKGLWGSEYYSEHPIYPIDKTSVDLNTDMIGRVDTERKTADSLNYIYVIGHDKLSSDLPIINEGVNNKYTKLVLDYKFDDPNDKNRIYYRSDHYNFAKKGIPILFFYDGMLLADYHKQTDTVDKINFELMEKRARMIFHTGWVMANRDDMLKRDTPLNMPSTR